MRTVTSKDGTTIAFEQTGQGPTLIMIDGALQHPAPGQGPAPLDALLAEHFTVIHHSRRGRGGSTDTPPYAVEREVEDIEALIDVAGGSAVLCGHSSGAALAMEAAIQLGDKVKKLAMYEAPYNDDPTAQQAWREYTQELAALLAAGRRGDAVARFMRLVGIPAAQIEGMRQGPMWPMLEAVAPTLAYDHISLMGENAVVPVERAAKIEVPTLVMNGGASFPFMHTTAVALAGAIPNAQHRVLTGQTHDVAAEALAPALVAFFTG